MQSNIEKISNYFALPISYNSDKTMLAEHIISDLELIPLPLLGKVEQNFTITFSRSNEKWSKISQSLLGKNMSQILRKTFVKLKK